MTNHVFSRDIFYSGMVLFTCRILIGNISRVTFSAVSLTEVAEKLALVAFRLFSPGPFDFMPLSVARFASKVCQLGDCADRLAHARHACLQPEYSTLHRVVIEFVIDA